MLDERRPPAMNDPHPSPTPRRLFTAIFPDAAACAAIDAERQRWDGLPRRLRPAPDRMHLTLQFFNRVDASAQRSWSQALTALGFEPFRIVLDRAELWRTGSGTIAVLRPAPNPALQDLHRATDALAAQAGLQPESRAFKPHLTTLRHAERVTLAPLAAPIAWTVRQVDLIWSDLAAQPPRYVSLGAFGRADL